MIIRRILVVGLLVLSFDSGGCASKTASKSKDDDEYVTLPPATGSYLGRRVKKSDLNKADTGTSAVATVSGDAIAGSYLGTPKAGDPPAGMGK